MMNCTHTFVCRIERLQDFARLFPQDTSVKNAETRIASRSKQQKRVNEDRSNSSPKVVSSATLYFLYKAVLP
jgi:hypothetical protein